MVLTQPGCRVDTVLGKVMFPYHYGSHATRQGELRCCGIWFPYHYGSHATRKANPCRTPEDVSIPLWFSRNSFYYKNYTRLAEAKSNLLCSFVGKTFRVRIRVSLVSEILYFEPDLTL